MDLAKLKNGEDQGGALASQRDPSKPAEFQFERPDWTLFRNVDTLSQKAGVSKDKLRRLVLKELTDNALDSGAGTVMVTEIDADTFRVADTGPGILGEPEAIARLFSVNRPLVSSKLWRMPSRGAMGNGLRVVMGAVAASDGSLVVTTRGRRLELQPRDDGATAILSDEVVTTAGTAIEITFGPAVPRDPRTTRWADAAVNFAAGGESFTGRPSPWWYDGDAFFELLRGAGDRPVRDLVEGLDGCSGSKAGKIASAFRGMPCNRMTREEALMLLASARAVTNPVRPQRLGRVGEGSGLPDAYAIKRGSVSIGGRDPKAVIPFVVEVWAEIVKDQGKHPVIDGKVNRTPIVGDLRAYRDKSEVQFYGCGLAHDVKVPTSVNFLAFNITTPWCPITTDGKEPDLSPFVHEIGLALESAGRKAKASAPRFLGERRTHKSIVLERLAEGVAKASGGGQYRFNQRQLFYVLRPYVQAALGAELDWNNFCQIVTDYEETSGDIAGMYRDPRGTLYHPHLGQDITLGTLAVEQYHRPAWTFGQVLYLEKEGFFEALKAARWPERHDCALLTSKGFATRAVRDLIDFLGDGEEPVRVFCVHDADASGTMIYQGLQEATRARGRRTVEIVNFGLEPWEAVEMGLSVETVEESNRRKPVADYIINRDGGEEWVDWLQGQRVELNEMTTPQLIAWLDAKMDEHSGGKVVPPAGVIDLETRSQLTTHVRSLVTGRVLREARVDEQVEGLVAGLALPSGADLAEAVTDYVGENEDRAWVEGIGDIVADIAAEVPR